MVDLITADLQLTSNPRDSYRHDFMAGILPGLLRKYQPDRLIILGDLTEEKDRHSAQLVNQIVGHFHHLLEDVLEIVFLQGNHDYLDQAHPFFAFLRKIGVVYISKPTRINRGGSNCLFLPHTVNAERDWGNLNFNKVDWIFAHNTFAGAIGSQGIKLEGVPLSIFPKGARVIAGDVHTPQTVGPVQYVGAPYLVDFGDDYEPRVLLREGNKVKSIPVSGVQKRLVEFKWPDLPKRPVNARGDIVKVRCWIKSEHMADWPEIREKIERWAASLELVVHQIQPIVEQKPGAPVSNSGPAGKMDDMELLKAYAKRQDVDDRTLDVGLDLLD